ncbi:hypothetical protein [Hyalangium versicolor]|uniref:hypothetical protein n=1 Tax=Hyalangium versicolor TaxID=2861190 RepID=UPI001CCF1FFF|nr:hypothetical protein [Hyalangium versicolor]
MKAMTIAALALASLLAGSAVAGPEADEGLARDAWAPTGTHELQPLTGGTTAPDVLDVTTLPFLALPKSDASGIGMNATSGPNCATPQGPLPPSGWTVVQMANVPTCSYPYTSGYYSICLPGGACFNQYTYRSYYDIPVGGTLRYCSAVGVPPGWQVIQMNLPASCPGSGADSVMQHVSCVAGDTNCYPQSASISASPQTVTVPYGLPAGSTTINWNTTNYSDPCVWVQNSGGGVQLWACSGGGAHSGVWPYVPAGGTTTLWISNGGSASPSPNIAQVVVTGRQGTAPTLSASPRVVTIPEGQAGSTTVSYNLSGSGHTGMCVWVQNSGGIQQVWACSGGNTFTAVWPYVPKGGTSTIWLSPSQTSPTPVLATVTVTGQ